ncbi:MAG TPA: helix-turn-helix transcriptional regulator [Firmicutes bacterium]|nr:helix-turn-helix transcriptional regulator [Bacillota bacterium]
MAKSTGIDAILDHVVYEARTGNIFVDWIMRGHLLSVLGLIGRQLQDIFENMEAEPAVARNQNKNIGKAISFIEANYADPGIGVPDIARHIGLCPNYFSVYFKKHIGQSPYNYLLRTRIKSAGQLLCESDLSVSEIAYKVGFTDPRHFSTMFKRMCGVSPSVYRNSTRSLDLITKCLP